MTKPPVVYTAGLLRATGQPVTTDAWTWLNGLCGQQLFHPPNVSGWDDGRWLDTATFLARWHTAGKVLRPLALDPKGTAPFDADALVRRALATFGDPLVTDATKKALRAFADRALKDADKSWKRGPYAVMTENALRQLIAVSPELQTA